MAQLPLLWWCVCGTFGAMALWFAIIAAIGAGFDQTRIAALAVATTVLTIALWRTGPPAPGTRHAHLMLAACATTPATSMLAFAPHGSAVAITATFCASLIAMWAPDRRQMAGFVGLATAALFTPPALGLVDHATVATCFGVAPALWGLTFTTAVLWERAEAQGRDLARLSMRDPLTGVGNRRLLEQELALALAAPETAARPLSLVVLDLDGFKALNDTVGHAAGDALLRETAGALQACARPNDTVARQGGDEFCILAPDTGEIVAHELAARIRDTLADIDLDEGTISASIGVATFPTDGRDAGALFATADTRCYADKSNRAARVAAGRAPADRSNTLNGPAVECIDGIGRRQLATLPVLWRVAAGSMAANTLLSLGILVFARELGSPFLWFAFAFFAGSLLRVSLTDPPEIGTVSNHVYIALAYVGPMLFALSTHPGAIGLGMAAFAGPLISARLVHRGEINAHALAATLCFGAVIVAQAHDASTVIATLTVISNVWTSAIGGAIALEAVEADGEALAQIVRRDPLTGLGNRRRLDEVLAAEVHPTDGHHLSVITLDLNGFKYLNDTRGHAAGDTLLRGVAEAITARLPAGAEAIRQGGDEFAVVIPGADPSSASTLAETLRRAVCELGSPYGVPVGTGIGVATAPNDGTTGDMLLGRADERLRLDKYGDPAQRRAS